jgi:hypothetical protein
MGHLQRKQTQQPLRPLQAALNYQRVAVRPLVPPLLLSRRHLKTHLSLLLEEDATVKRMMCNDGQKRLSLGGLLSMDLQILSTVRHFLIS